MISIKFQYGTPLYREPHHRDRKSDVADPSRIMSMQHRHVFAGAGTRAVQETHENDSDPQH
jgi:hypothetical protein